MPLLSKTPSSATGSPETGQLPGVRAGTRLSTGESPRNAFGSFQTREKARLSRPVQMNQLDARQQSASPAIERAVELSNKGSRLM